MDRVRLLAMARKEWIQLKRDTRSMILAFVLPLFLLLFFGYAITWDVNDIRIAVLDQDRTRESRDLLEAFVSSGYFTVTTYLDAPSRVDDQLVRQRVRGFCGFRPGTRATWSLLEGPLRSNSSWTAATPTPRRSR